MEAVLERVTIDVDKASVLSKVGRMFTQTAEAVLLELFQNARRAGARNIEVWLCGDRTMISNDGRALTNADWKAMFNLGSSGWDGETMSEDPAGCGFFIASMYDKVTLASRPPEGQMQVVRTGRNVLTKVGEELEIEYKDPDGMPWSFSITLNGGGPDFDPKLVTKIAERLDIRVTIKIADTNNLIVCNTFTESLEKENSSLQFLETVGNVEWYLDKDYWHYRNEHCTLNYHGHIIKFHKINDKELKIYKGEGSKTLSLYARVVGPTDLRLILPGRTSLVENEAAEKLIHDGRCVNGRRLSEMTSHTLTYLAYEYVKETNPELKEARMPTWALDLSEDDKRFAVYDSRHSLLASYMVAQASGAREADNYNSMRRYSWMKALEPRIFCGSELRVEIDGEKHDQHGWESVKLDDYDAYRFESLKVLGVQPHDKSPDDVEISETVLWEPDGLLLESGDESHFYGSGFDAYALGLFVNKGLSSNESNQVFDDIHGYVTEKWEASDDSESDSYDTQNIEFFGEFTPWLRNAIDPGAGLADQVASSFKHTSLPDCGIAVSANEDRYALVTRWGWNVELRDKPRRVNCSVVDENTPASTLLWELAALDKETLLVLVKNLTR